MTKPKILIVEDEQVVAADIQDCLERLGYAVVGTAASGIAAIRKAVEAQPDLVLMDIRLKGAMDGIETARELHAHLDIPVVFLSAYADAEILERAKGVCPAGYVLKPFDERSVRSAIELALHNHPRTRRIAGDARRLELALNVVEDGLIVTGADGCVAAMNHAAEVLTGWRREEAQGKKIAQLLPLVKPQGGLAGNVFAVAAYEREPQVLSEGLELVTRQGWHRRVQGTVTPLIDEEQRLIGLAVKFRALPSQATREAAAPEPVLLASQRLPGRLVEALALELVGRVEKALKRLTDADTPGGPEWQEIRNRLAVAGELARRLAVYGQLGEPAMRPLELNSWLAEVGPLAMLVAGNPTRLSLRCENSSLHVCADPMRLECAILGAIAEMCSQPDGSVELTTGRTRLLEAFARAFTRLEPGEYASLQLVGPGLPQPVWASLEHDLRSLVWPMSGDVHLEKTAQGTCVEVYLPLAAGEEKR